MSPNRRIFLNFVATYGRSLYVIAVGLFCGRWTLMALGEVDYGLLGLVGGLIGFISFFNSLMATAVGRFLAFSVGEAQTKGDDGIEECRRWFSVSVLLHTVVPVIALVVGYPIGEWAVRHFLTIPADRVEDCVWVWRFVCLSGFVSMVSVPFDAMYMAKQYIAELTIYTFVTSTLNAFFLYYMVTHPGVWLVRLSMWSCLLTIAPQVIIAIRASWLFPECRMKFAYMWEWRRVREVSVYAFYRFFGALGMMVRKQATDILINKILGPTKNAAMNIGATVSGHSNSLGGSLLSALAPAITNAYGAKDMERVKKLSFAACKLTAVLALVFVVPLLLEADEVFRLWLKNPPEGCVVICKSLLVVLVFENMTCGHYISIFADGRIRNYQTWCLCASCSAVPIVWILLLHGLGMMAVACSLVIAQAIVVVVRLYFAKRICGFFVSRWFCSIALPLVICAIVALAVGYLPHIFLEQSFWRVVLTTVVANGVFLPLTWFFALDGDEKNIFRTRILNRLKSWSCKG